MQQPEHVAVFWDFENLPPRSGVPGYETVQAIRSLAHDFGVIISFKAYLEVSSTLTLWSEIQAAGVALIDCPHHRRAEAARKMLLVDMITFAIDHPAPATIFLISADRDFGYAISTLRHRKYKVVVLCPPDTHNNLVAQADAHFDWNAKVLCESEGDEPPLAPPSPAPQRPRHLSTPLNGVIPSDSDRKGKERDGNDEEGVGRRPHRDHQTFSYSYRHNHTHPTTASTWPTPSRTTSRPYSPAGSFRSAESAPPTPSPKHKSVEPTFVTDGDIIFECSSQPALREGFPFSENATTKEPVFSESLASAPANAVVKTPPLVPTSLPLPSVEANAVWNSPTPAFVPATVAEPVTPVTTSAPTSTKTVLPPAGTAASTLPSKVSKTKSIPTNPTKPPPSPPLVRPAPPRPAIARPAPSHFLPLISALQRRAQDQKQKEVMRTDLGTDLAKVKGLYAQAKVSKFASYILLAEEAGIVTLGGSGSNAWVTLRPEWTSSSKFPSQV